MQHLKSLTIEKDRVRRKRRLGPDMYNPLDPNSHDNSIEGDEDDDEDDKPMMPSGSAINQEQKSSKVVFIYLFIFS